MAEYNHPEKKIDEPSAAAVISPAPNVDEVEATDRGLFDFAAKKKEEETKKGEGGAVATEFDEKVKVSEEEKKDKESEKHGSLLEKLRRSNSSSSSVSSLHVSHRNNVVLIINISCQYLIFHQFVGNVTFILCSIIFKMTRFYYFACT